MRTARFAPILLSLVAACSTTYPNRSPLGESFPSVKGKALSGEEWQIPEGMRGKPALLLIGYKQNSQFDIDRWFIGLDMTKTDVDVYELPTIQGIFPRMISGSIDEGMRSGIPEPIWKAVITVYADGARVQEFTGNERPLNARVVLIDAEGKVRYFHDRGFAVPNLNELRAEIDELTK